MCLIGIYLNKILIIVILITGIISTVHLWAFSLLETKYLWACFLMYLTKYWTVYSGGHFRLVDILGWYTMSLMVRPEAYVT